MKQRKKEETDYTLLLCSCDAYEDCWDPFFTLLERYWPEAKNHPIIVNTESKTFAKEGWDIQCFHLYKEHSRVSYGTRMIAHLKRVKTSLVLVMLDDFFLRSPVDQKRLDACVESMKQCEDITCFNFASVEQQGFVCKAHPGFQELYPIADYRLNMQAALWRTAELRSYWKPGASPWTLESLANRKTECTPKKFYFLMENAPLIFDYGRKPGLTWGVVRGQWCRSDIEPLFQKEGIQVDCRKRGWFDSELFEKEQNAHEESHRFSTKLRRFVLELYLGGGVFAFRRLCYAVKKVLFRYSQSYDEYMRRTYNPAENSDSAVKGKQRIS